MGLTAIWLDGECEPQCAPNPLYPSGKDIDISHHAEATCSMTLPYPAPRCGIYLVECSDCGQKVGVTTAGRVDDPRSVKIACLKQPRKN